VAAIDQADILAAQDVAEECVTTRELPSLGVWIESSPAPIQLNGRNNVKFSPSMP